MQHYLLYLQYISSYFNLLRYIYQYGQNSHILLKEVRDIPDLFDFPTPVESPLSDARGQRLDGCGTVPGH